MSEPLNAMSERKIYPPANECIYCGIRNVRLTDEHTFPDGLLGQHILPKASCGTCQKTINEEIEQYCLRTLFAHLRAADGMKSRKKRPSPPATLQVKRRTGKIERIVVDPSDFRAFALPVFPEPCFITGEPVSETINGWWWLYHDPSFDTVLIKYDVESVLTETIMLNKLARLVAKTAHAHAWALWGPVFEPYLPPIILGKDRFFHRFVGGWGTVLKPALDYAHKFRIMYWKRQKGDKDAYLIAEVRFFSDRGGPTYYAVVGKALIPWPFPEREGF